MEHYDATGVTTPRQTVKASPHRHKWMLSPGAPADPSDPWNSHAAPVSPRQNGQVRRRPREIGFLSSRSEGMADQAGKPHHTYRSNQPVGSSGPKRRPRQLVRQYDHLDGAVDPQRPAVACPIRARGHLRAQVSSNPAIPEIEIALDVHGQERIVIRPGFVLW